MNLTSSKIRTVRTSSSVGARETRSSVKARETRGAVTARETRGAERVPRVRRRTEHAVRPRAQRHGKLDIDALYFSELSESKLLTAADEVAIATRIAVAERAIVAAVVSAPAARSALLRLAEDLAAHRVDVRAILLNPDEAGLDLIRVEGAVHEALRAASSADPETRGASIETLARLRLARDVVDGVVEIIESAATDSAADADAAQAIARARLALARGKEQLVVGNLRLVLLFARRYVHRGGVPLSDLVQEGNLGLMRAADKFEIARGFRFSTYAAWWVKQAIHRALLDRVLRLPAHVADDRRRVAKLRTTFLTKHRRSATAEEIAELAGLPQERVEAILTLPLQPASLDAPTGEDGETTLGDLVAADTPLPDASASLRALVSDLTTLLDTLSPREQQVVRMRFGLAGAREHTLEEVGRALTLTRERIRQIERGALDKLKAREADVELRSYLER